jgi:hypothetical protein
MTSNEIGRDLWALTACPYPPDELGQVDENERNWAPPTFPRMGPGEGPVPERLRRRRRDPEVIGIGH